MLAAQATPGSLHLIAGGKFAVVPVDEEMNVQGPVIVTCCNFRSLKQFITR
jgi:hypothetical protein